MKIITRSLAALASACFALIPCNAAAPIDDAKKDPSLLVFRQQLLAAVKRRDDKYVKGILSPSVKYGLGGGVGQYEFMRNYEFLKKDSPFWTRFSNAITHGGSLQPAEDGKGLAFNAPYSWFANATNSSEQGVICDSNVAVLERPDATAKKLTVSSYDIVQVPSTKPIVEDFMKVLMPDGRTGYVHRAQLILRSDPYAVFQKDAGQWKLTWFGSVSP